GGDVSRTWAAVANRSTLVNATASGIGSGMANTNSIQAQTGNAAADTAAVYAYDYSNGGKIDWHLPSLNELNELCKYARQQTTGNTAVTCSSSGSLRSGFAGAHYWSSTEDDSFDGWDQDFTNGFQSTYDKSWNYRVRPIRAFG
ncbi:MAG: DUF1566 domain-containing protein, partial [Actinomycetota bacterium]